MDGSVKSLIPNGGPWAETHQVDLCWTNIVAIN